MVKNFELYKSININDPSAIVGYRNNFDDTWYNSWQIQIMEVVQTLHMYLDFEKFDIIYAMDKNNYGHLIALTKNQEERKKIRMILNETYPGLYKSVPDPYYGGKNGFEEVYNMLDKACNKIADQIE